MEYLKSVARGLCLFNNPSLDDMDKAAGFLWCAALLAATPVIFAVVLTGIAFSLAVTEAVLKFILGIA